MLENAITNIDNNIIYYIVERAIISNCQEEDYFEVYR